jgi:hypothetical protein
MNRFRLPTIHELRSLVWLSDEEKEVFHQTFPNSKDWFWSSSPYASYNNNAWYVDFGGGYVGDFGKDGSNRVRLVRAGQCKDFWHFGDDPSTRYVVSECGEFVTDRSTGLEWKREPEEGTYTWREAMKKFGGEV